MGFNFQSGHHDDILGDEEGEAIASILRRRFGNDVPLGRPGSGFCIHDEMGWSWWSAPQRFGAEALGKEGSRHLRAVDAWHAVYVDVQVEREVLWPDGRNAGPVIKSWWFPCTWKDRLRRMLRMGPKPSAADAEAHAAISEMIKTYGARAGEGEALQVGGLRGVMAEAELLLRRVGVEPTEQSVEHLRRDYSTSDDRCDDDPHIQCLCHLWLTGTHALAHEQPLWLLK